LAAVLVIRFALLLLFLHSIVGAAVPQRIVSTSPNITEILFALGLGPHVVGVSRYCVYPPEVTKLPKVGTYLNPDPELIARLTPDLVIVNKLPGNLSNRLSALGIHYTQVDTGSLTELYSEIYQIGKEAGVPDRAAALTNQIRQHLDQIHARTTGRKLPTVLFVVGRRPGTLSDIIAAGPGSYISDLIAAAGGKNVLSENYLPAYPKISMEMVIRFNPDVIIDAMGMEGTPDESERTRLANEALWMQQPKLEAVRHRNVHSVMSTAFVVPGPRIMGVVDMLYDIFYREPRH
jgi:iron complex transport system substrate-binding protein